MSYPIVANSHRLANWPLSFLKLTLTPTLTILSKKDQDHQSEFLPEENKEESTPKASNVITNMGRPYGRHDLKLLESNNPNALSGPVSCYPPQKVISPLGSSALSTASDLYDVYERKQDGIHDVVLDELRSQGLVGDDGRGGRSAVVKSFGLVRMGFVHQQKHPTVLLVVVKKGSFSASNAGPGQELKPDARSALTVLHKLERRVALVFAKEENEEQEETNTGDNEKRQVL